MPASASHKNLRRIRQNHRIRSPGTPRKRCPQLGGRRSGSRCIIRSYLKDRDAPTASVRYHQTAPIRRNPHHRWHLARSSHSNLPPPVQIKNTHSIRPRIRDISFMSRGVNCNKRRQMVDRNGSSNPVGIRINHRHSSRLRIHDIDLIPDRGLQRDSSGWCQPVKSCPASDRPNPRPKPCSIHHC